MTPRIRVTILFAILLLGLAPFASGATPPMLRVTTSAGQIANVDFTGTVAFSGSCTAVTCKTSAGYPLVSTGQISWSGTLGTFSILASIGVTKPTALPNPSLDLNLQSIKTTADGTITFEWTDTNFNYTGITGGTLAAGGLITGGNASFKAYFDDTNTPFGTGIPVGTLGPFSPRSFNGTVDGPGPTAAPFSMTQVAILNLTANATFGVDYQFIALPSPLKLQCAAATGQVGVPYSSALMALGGVPPYTYSIVTGALPNGLTLNSATGAITGVPTQAGTFSFTAQVVDSSGDGAINTTTTNCSITITTPPPISLACAGAVGQVGVAYNSALIASGGVPPYAYSISSGALPDGLTLNPATGAITGTPLTAGTFNFTGKVVDSTGTIAGTATSNCAIVISPAPPTLACASSAGKVGTAYSSALVASGGVPPYTYSITTGSLPPGLTLDANSGAITGTPTTAGTFNFTAQVVDSRGNAAGTSTSNCGITISPSPISLQCAATTGTVGVPYSSALVASGGVGPYTYSIVTGSLPPGLTLNPSTGAITGTPTTAGPFNFTAKVVDSTGSAAGTTTSDCGITIAPPPISAQCVSATTGTVGTAYSSAIAVTGGTGPYTFAIASGSLPNGLTLDTTTGVISGTPTTAGPFSFTVSVTDSTPGVHATATTGGCGITIAPPTISAQCVQATTGTVGTAYSSAIVVTGGTAPYTFAIASGSLPNGLTLNTSTGVISGTPTTAGPFSFTVSVTDSTPGVHATTTTSSCGITIAPPTISAQCVQATTGTVGTAYSSAIVVTGGTAPYAFAIASGSLPNGLTLDTTTGVISGTPTTAGPFSFTVSVTDSTPGVHATTTTSGCGITIAPPTISAQCVQATTGTVGTAYSSAIVVTGGTAPYTFAVASGSLPNGLTLNTSTGVISGTPTTAGPFSFTVSVTDSTPGVHATTTTSSCGITIAPPTISAQCVQTTTGTVGTAYSSAIVVTGGTAPYTFALASGSLPNGLTLDTTTGVISGTPTTAGPFSFTVSVTDSTPGTHATATTSSCGITIAPPTISAQCVQATTGTVGTAYSSAIVVTGGTAPYTFALASGSLPNGLTLNTSTGVISGTPTTAGPFSFTVSVTDSTPGTHATATTSNCGITIAPPTISAQCVSATTGTVGVAYSSAIVVTGGTAPYTFALASGSLPNGLTLNTSTGVISGTPTTAGPFSFTVSVTDSTPGVHATATTSNCGITITGLPTANCAVINAVAGVPIAPVTMVGSGGAGGPYSFSAVGLPSGLTMSAGGTISGTPTVSGVFSYTVTVKDKDGNTGTANCSVTVNPPPTNVCGLTWGYWKNHAWPVNSLTLGSQTYNQAELQAILASSVSGDASLSLAHQLIAAKFNVLNGTPITTDGGATAAADAILSTFPNKLPYNVAPASTVGAQMVSIAAQLDTFNSDGQGQPGCTNGPTPLTLTCAANSGKVGVAYSSAIVVTGGIGPYTFSITSGALPGGLTLNPDGTITGTPTTAGTFNFSVTVTDSTNIGGTLGSITSNCSITITGQAPPPPITLSCPPGANGTVGSFFTTTVAAAGGVSPYTYSIAAGALPTGLTLNTATGVISGTPTVAGAFSFTIKVVDSLGASALSTCSQNCGGTTTWDFSTPIGNLGNSEPYTVNGLTVTAYGYTTANVPAALFGHNDDAANLGLGIYGTSSDKIDTTHYVQLDLGAVIAAGGTNATITVSSVQAGESYTVYGSNTLGSIGIPLLSNQTAAGVALPIPTTYRYISVKAVSGVVSIAEVDFTLGTCQIVITKAIDLQCGSCGANKDTVGKPYSSQLQVIGGIGPYTYSIVSGSLPPGLTLNTSTGVISGTPTTAGTYTFTTKVVDSQGNSDTATCTIMIIAPPLDLQCGTCGANKGYVGTVFSAQLAPTGGAGGNTYSIVSGSLPPGLTLNTSTGVISGTPTTAGTYTFTTKVVDSAGNYDTATCTIIILTSPVNLDCGTCGAGKATVGTAYLEQLSVTGGAGPYTFSIISGSLPPGLTLNTTTGKVSGTPTTAGTYTFTSKVVDSKGYSDTATCTIVVVGGPQINLDCGFCGSAHGKVGSPYSAALAVTGGTGPFTYSKVSGTLPPGLTLNTSTGVVSGTPTTAGTYTITFKVVDSKGNSDTVTCTVIIDGAPINLDCGTCGVGKGTVGTAYSATFAVTGGTGPFTYSKVSGTLPPGLTLGASTGKLTGTPTTAGTYTFTIKVVDSKGNSDTVTCTVIVVASPVNLDCGTCGSQYASVGTAHTSTLKATGGTAPYTYSVATGLSLPPGLTLNASTGVISGTPTTAGTFTFTTKVVDSKGNSDTATCTLVVSAPPLDLQCGTCGANKATKGRPYSVTLAAKGGNPTYTYSISSGALPAGLTLNASTGVISGTPTAIGTYTFTSKVTDSKGKTDTATCTIVVVAPVDLQCGSCGTGKAYKGTAYSSTLAVNGGTGPFTFSIVSGALPGGLTLNASTGVISGTPTATGTFTFTSKVVDANGSTDTTICTIIVSLPPVDLQCGSCSASKAVYHKSYSAAEQATGGTGVYTYSIISGSLPPGLTLNTSTGVISGWATVTGGTFTFTTKVVDSAGSSDTVTCTITVSMY